MQLGTRWQSGSTPPSVLPDSLRAAIANVERDTQTQENNGNALYWTLTWLENRPICRFDTGITLRVDAHGRVVKAEDSVDGDAITQDDDSWLS